MSETQHWHYNEMQNLSSLPSDYRLGATGEDRIRRLVQHKLQRCEQDLGFWSGILEWFWCETMIVQDDLPLNYSNSARLNLSDVAPVGTLSRGSVSIHYQDTSLSLRPQPLSGMRVIGSKKLFNVSMGLAFSQILRSVAGESREWISESLLKSSKIFSPENKIHTLKVEVRLDFFDSLYDNPSASRNTFIGGKISLGDVGLTFGKGSLPRPGYPMKIYPWTNRPAGGLWLEITTPVESMILTDRGFCSFLRNPRIASMFTTEDPHGPVIDPLVQMVHPQGEFIIDRPEFFMYTDFPDQTPTPITWRF